MKKKALAMLLAAAMTLSMSAAAFADDVTDLSEEQSLEFTTVTKAPTLKVTVPAADAVVFNPYGMSFTLQGEVDGASDTEERFDQVFNLTKHIVNKSDVAIKVSAAVTAEVSEGMKLATAAVKGDAKDKQVFVKMNYLIQDDTSAPDNDAWGKNAVTAVAPSSKAPTKKDLGTLALSEDKTNPSAGGVLAFRIDGNAAKNPGTAWTNDDTVTVAAFFSFLPQTTEQETT